MFFFSFTKISLYPFIVSFLSVMKRFQFISLLVFEFTNFTIKLVDLFYSYIQLIN